jgi:hypothetical protein
MSHGVRVIRRAGDRVKEGRGLRINAEKQRTTAGKEFQHNVHILERL